MMVKFHRLMSGTGLFLDCAMEKRRPLWFVQIVLAKHTSHREGVLQVGSSSGAGAQGPPV